MACANQLGRFLLAALVVFAIAPNSFSLVIAYELEDLPDQAGLDLWSYRYFLSGESLEADYGFSTRFALHDTLSVTPVATSAGVDWDIIALQPDPLLAEDGLFDARARVDGATFDEPFVVQFAWAGAAPPGTQIFEVYDSAFEIFASGQTVPIPEPETCGLLGVGLAWLASRTSRTLWQVDVSLRSPSMRPRLPRTNP